MLFEPTLKRDQLSKLYWPKWRNILDHKPAPHIFNCFIWTQGSCSRHQYLHDFLFCLSQNKIKDTTQVMFGLPRLLIGKQFQLIAGALTQNHDFYILHSNVDCSIASGKLLQNDKTLEFYLWHDYFAIPGSISKPCKDNTCTPIIFQVCILLLHVCIDDQ